MSEKNQNKKAIETKATETKAAPKIETKAAPKAETKEAAPAEDKPKRTIKLPVEAVTVEAKIEGIEVEVVLYEASFGPQKQRFGSRSEAFDWVREMRATTKTPEFVKLARAIEARLAKMLDKIGNKEATRDEVFGKEVAEINEKRMAAMAKLVEEISKSAL